MTHEYWQPDDPESPVLNLPPEILAFDELPRDPESRTSALYRDIRLLGAQSKADPTNPRWWYFLGQTWNEYAPQEPNVALTHWLKAAKATGEGWEELKAWSAFRAAEMLGATDPKRAVDTALLGLKAYPQMPELLWVLGAAHLALNEPSKALTWALMATAVVQFDKATPVARSGFRWQPAFFEAPLEIMSNAFQQMGMEEEAHQSAAAAIRLKAAREGT